MVERFIITYSLKLCYITVLVSSSLIKVYVAKVQRGVH